MFAMAVPLRSKLNRDRDRH